MMDQIKFNYHNKMIKNFLRALPTIILNKTPKSLTSKISPSLTSQLKHCFCSEKTHSATTPIFAPEQIKISTAKVGQQEVDMVQTKGAISIMDRVPGVKAQNGELYVLSFTCTKCETKQIRSFTKHAYHKGVVLVRCGGCENIHLVADNIGWFEDTPINIETMHQGKVKRIQDPIVIGKFLETAFKDQPQKEHL